VALASPKGGTLVQIHRALEIRALYLAQGPPKLDTASNALRGSQRIGYHIRKLFFPGQGRRTKNRIFRVFF
jgi:hypothetical protein